MARDTTANPRLNVGTKPVQVYPNVKQAFDDWTVWAYQRAL